MDAIADAALIDRVRRGLREVADRGKATQMQTYMKSEMPFYGVPRPAMKVLCRHVFSEHRLPDRAAWEATVRQLWDSATYREERYCAIELTGHRLYRNLQCQAALPLYDHLVVTGAWWDYVDEIASRRVGPILRAFPDPVRPIVRAWSRDEDMWRRRTAILAQLLSKEQTDTELLVAVIEPNLADEEFFIRKAIGWALRQYAHTDPAWVRDYVGAHADEMSALTCREATKHLR